MVLKQFTEYENWRQPPLSRAEFVQRLLSHGGLALVIIAGSLTVGVAGYHWLGEFGWVDSFLNASMILGGMGPVGDLRTTSAKLFAACYALYAGMAFIIVAGVVLTPVFHRVLHRFHWDEGQAADGK